MSTEPRLLAWGLSWPEAPRWRDGALWISDVHNFRIARVGLDGSVTTACRIEGRPSGMDFAADGSLLLATGLSKQLLRVDLAGQAVTPLAELSDGLRGLLNDLVITPNGTVLVGDTGFLFGIDEPRRTGRLLAWHPATGPQVAAEDIFFPNGMAVSPDGGTLYLVETFGKCITAFDLHDDGTISAPRLHAALPGSPDGLCLDADGCLWAPLLFEEAFVRVAPDGKVIDRIDMPGRNAISCVFGGEDRRTLFLCVAAVDHSDPENLIRNGEVHMVALPTGGAGRP